VRTPRVSPAKKAAASPRGITKRGQASPLRASAQAAPVRASANAGSTQLRRVSKNGVRVPKTKARLAEELAGEGEPVRVYADGIYDLFHYGHARSLEQAKKLFPNATLVVGVCSDADTHRIKGSTVMDEKQRAESVRHCKWVDEVVENSPWVLDQAFLDKHQIDYVSHGEDLSLDENGNDAYAWLKEQNLFRVIKRTEGISTSDIIMKIVRDYDTYVRRNLKRGFTATDMNVGLLKRGQIAVEEALTPISGFVGAFNKRWSEFLSPRTDDEHAITDDNDDDNDNDGEADNGKHDNDNDDDGLAED